MRWPGGENENVHAGAWTGKRVPQFADSWSASFDTHKAVAYEHRADLSRRIPINLVTCLPIPWLNDELARHAGRAELGDWLIRISPCVALTA
jgi:hypothetical protein